jgi:hypothetical protein
LIGSIQFRFYKPETKKTKLNPNRKKPSQTEKTEPNLKKPSQTEPKLVGLNWFRFKKNGLITFFDKNQTEPKMITST